MQNRSQDAFDRAALIALVAGLLAAPVVAEHRVALLIDNTRLADDSLATQPQDLEALADALAKYGVRCTLKRDLEDQKQLGEAIEHFADHTPTASTAIVYFAGLAAPGKYNGKDALVLVGTDARKDRGYPLRDALQALYERGGSRLNVVVVDSPQTPKLKHEPPAQCLIAFNDHAALIKNLDGNREMLTAIRAGSDFDESTISHRTSVSGRGNDVISPPDQFVPGTKAGDEWIDRRGAVFVWCPPGRYVKGSPADESGRYPDETQEEVVIKDGFWISKYELTLSENLRGRSHKTIAEHKNHPVTMINHDDIRRMTQKTMTEAAQQHADLPKDWQYNLPTEEQWEYAARAGTTTRYYFGNDVSQLPEHANFADRTYYDTGSVYSQRAHRTLDDGVAYLARVGTYQPNPWGLYDIHGNVAEWCLGGATRGGSWTSTPGNCRAAFGQHFSSRNEQNFIGYRVVIQKTPPAKSD